MRSRSLLYLLVCAAAAGGPTATQAADYSILSNQGSVVELIRWRDSTGTLERVVVTKAVADPATGLITYLEINCAPAIWTRCDPTLDPLFAGDHPSYFDDCEYHLVFGAADSTVPGGNKTFDGWSCETGDFGGCARSSGTIKRQSSDGRYVLSATSWLAVAPSYCTAKP